MKKINFTIFYLFLSIGLKAAINPNVSVADTSRSPLSINGFLDTYYFGNFNAPKSMSNLGAGSARILDQKANAFQIGFVDLKATYSTNKVDAIIELAFGNHADLGSYGNILSPIAGVTSTALAVKQAYIIWKAAQNFSFTIGQYTTHVGSEILDSPVNYNYSLSNLFYSQPFYHSGIKATYALGSKASVMLGLVNAVDSKDAFSSKKGLSAQLSITPKTGYAFYLNYLNSEKAGTTGPLSYSIIDFVANMQLSSQFYVGANLDFGSIASQTWSGYALYSNYAFSNIFGLGARYDHVDNANGVASPLSRNGKGTSVSSITLTGNIRVSDNLLIKPEFRLDSYPNNDANNEQFEDANGMFTKTSQATLGAAFIFHF